MKAAPALDCTECHKRIGKSRGHNVHHDGRVLCTRCVERGDLYNQLRYVCGTRAGTAAALGVWP